MNIQRQIGLNLRRLRLARDVSQHAIALDVEMSLSYLSNIERGQANPSVGIIGKIAGSLGVPAAEFFLPVSPKDVPTKNLRRGRNVHHQGRRSPKTGKR